jgi:hypothetical protein
MHYRLQVAAERCDRPQSRANPAQRDHQRYRKPLRAPQRQVQGTQMRGQYPGRNSAQRGRHPDHHETAPLTGDGRFRSATLSETQCQPGGLPDDDRDQHPQVHDATLGTWVNSWGPADTASPQGAESGPWQLTPVPVSRRSPKT